MNLSFGSRLNAVALLLLMPGVFGLFDAALASGKQTIPSAIQQQLNLPEHQIDIGLAALTFAKEFYPNLDIAAYSKRIDQIADKARQLAHGAEDPETRIRVLNTVIHQMEGIHYDHSPFARSRQDYYFLNGILDTKQGICYTLPLLYIAVGQRLGYPLYPVDAPDHMFVRYVDPSFTEQNVETTSGGKYFPDQRYIKAFAVSQRGLKSGSYLRTKTYREFLGDMLAANAIFFGRKGETGKTISPTSKKPLNSTPDLPITMTISGSSIPR